MKVDDQIMISNTAICKNIDNFSLGDRGFLSQNILDKLRTFVEQIAVKIAKKEEYSYKIYQTEAKHIISSIYKYKFLYQFHRSLQISKSHYIQSEQNSERLMLKYFEYLLKTKKLFKNEYNLDILQNIDKFPIKSDPILKVYYQKIAEKIESKKEIKINNKFNNNYYIWKIKTFPVDDEIYYEVTFSLATENNSKFDRVIAFTKIEILHNYSVKFKIIDDEIEVFDKKMPILIIKDYEVSIRPCEFSNLAKIFDEQVKISRNIEYKELMDFLTKKRFNLVEIIDFSDEKYRDFKEFVFKKARTNYIVNVLDKSRNIIINNKPGKNILRYLLYNLNNKIIKNQYGIESWINVDKNSKLSNLKLKFGCIPFDKMPFCSSPLGHNPKNYDLLDCINFSNREYEFFARHINNNTENNGKLYTEIKEINDFENISTLINKFNSMLYSSEKQQGRKLEIYKDYIYRKSTEGEIIDIVKIIKELGVLGFEGYSEIVKNWINKYPEIIDDIKKKEILRTMFEKSKVALVYGSAGTGKTMLIEHVSKLFENQNKLFLANTNPAVNNLKSRVNLKNSDFFTITKYLNIRNKEKYNILVIDECSTVNNSDILSVLKESKFDLLILVGDIYQIESINFGNWFSIIKNFVLETSIFELEVPYRTNNNNLIKLWNKVRNIEDDILENILPYSETLNDSIFDISDNDEIILCLNYDGLYGINNINRFLQRNNINEPIQWGTHIYKIGDPILFNETNRFSSLIYNNLKGKIINIEVLEDKIYFSIEVDKTIEENDVFLTELKLLEESDNGKSKIKFYVNKLENTDEDDNYSKHIVPFQVAYAVSIHKSQGLEYNSVKIIISDEIEEMLTHNIFYTAITRARKELKIYWSPETSKKVLENLEPRINKKDAYLLKNKFNL
ncbi:ATP-dependent RecD-like DNA helicase [Candidatus Gracilibacteria bacterium]|nr:ATP-dependent RecD-like DNA helicase [Candidatus Gracilibacteria bacterium]